MTCSSSSPLLYEKLSLWICLSSNSIIIEEHFLSVRSVPSKEYLGKSCWQLVWSHSADSELGMALGVWYGPGRVAILCLTSLLKILEDLTQL